MFYLALCHLEQCLYGQDSCRTTFGDQDDAVGQETEAELRSAKDLCTYCTG